MNKRLAIFAFVTGAALAACGGGGSTSGGGTMPQPVPTQTTTVRGNLPLSEAVGPSAGWVDPSSHRTLYFLDVDTATGGTCTAGCLGVWPLFVPAAGSANTDNMTIITRSDGQGQQWSYQGHPLYHYAGDSGPDQMSGDLIPDFGGHWHVARPSAATGGGGGGGNCGTYC